MKYPDALKSSATLYRYAASSARLALKASPREADNAVLVRRDATPAEIKAINQTQFDNLVEVVVGASRTVLETL